MTTHRMRPASLALDDEPRALCGVASPRARFTVDAPTCDKCAAIEHVCLTPRNVATTLLDKLRAVLS